MKEELKNILLMGLGAMSLTNDKAQELKEELLKKGTDMYESGKVANEELKHNIKEKIKENVTVVVTKNDDLSNEELAKKINAMSKEEKDKLLSLIKKNDITMTSAPEEVKQVKKVEIKDEK